MPSHVHKSNRLLKPLLALLAALSFVMSTGTAQPVSGGSQPPAIRIRDIRVEGATSSSPSAIIAFSGLHVGDILTSTSDAVSKAIKNLFERRLFSDVKIYAENIDATGATIIIRVKEYQRIGNVTITGNDEISEKDLKDLVTVRTGDIASPYDLDRSREKMKAKYAEEGYLFSKITAIQSPSADTGRVDVVFNIEEGPEVKIGTINFQGNSAVASSDLKGAMEDVKEKSWWQIWRSSKFDRKKLKSDETRIVDYYRSQGYIDAGVVGDSIGINPVTGRTDVRINVTEGKRVYLRSVSITGNTVYPSEVLMRRLDVETGVPYNQLQLEKNLNGNEEQTDVHSLYLDNGYLTFNAQLNEQRVSEDTVDVTIKIAEGGQSTIRYVTIVGNTKTKDKVIRRELYTRPGETFSKAAVIRSLRNLANLNYFNPERLQPDVQPVDATSVDLTYNVEEKPSDTFNASVGLSSQGLSGSLGVSFTNFSIAEPLLGGAGQILNFNWEFGTYQKTFSLGFTEPYLFDDPTSLGGSLFYQTRDVGSYQLARYGVTGNLGRRLRWPDDYFRLDFGFNALNNKISGDQSASSYYRNGSELSTALVLSRTSIDNPTFPTGGSRFSTSLTYAGFGGDANYFKPELKFEFFSTIAHVTETNPLVFYLGNEYGYLDPLGPSSLIPPTAFYSMGGTGIGGYNTVPLRGYADGTIGPVTGGIPVGAVYTKISSELRFGVSLNPIPIYMLAFAEAGNVWGKFREVDPFDLKRSVGAGIRVTVPGVGLLGFDYGYGFDLASNGEKGGWQFHFQFGR